MSLHRALSVHFGIVIQAPAALGVSVGSVQVHFPVVPTAVPELAVQVNLSPHS